MLPVQYARSSLHQSNDVKMESTRDPAAAVLTSSGEQIVHPPQIVVKDTASNEIVHPSQDPPPQQLNDVESKVLQEQVEPETPNQATVETQQLSSMSKHGPTPGKSFVDM